LHFNKTLAKSRACCQRRRPIPTFHAPTVNPARLLPSLIVLFSSIGTSWCVAADPVSLKLWPDGPPGAMAPKSDATVKQIQSYGGPTPTRVTDVTDPTITIYRPEKPNGASVVVAPGGGFMFLSYASEGTQVCEWLNTLGVTAVLLKYRTPTRDEKEPFTMPVQDAQRAIGIVRHHAAEWSLDPKRVGLLGFSAGANLTGHAAWDRAERTYPQKPELDDARGPDFIVFVYGGGFLDKEDKTKFRAGFSVPADAPPAFFVVAHDDKTNPVEATKLWLEYKRHGIPAEIHVMTKGGHGFGMRAAGNPINAWPARCGEWMKAMGWIGH
jgi:acetyl esterase/lipase